jgi:putative spermidine/putrescine transport system ATP-binding protein
VTHDQEEALAIADRVAVMSGGRLEQIAAPEELYTRPRTRFVAEFVGLTNALPATVDGEVATVLGARIPVLPGSVPGGPGTALVRPEWLLAVPDDQGGGTVVSRSFLGSLTRLTCRLADGPDVVVQAAAAEAAPLRPGTRVAVTAAPSPVLVVPADGSR